MSAPGADDLFRGSAVFAGLPPKEIDALTALAQENVHRTRSYVFMEGDPARWLYIVKRGRVKILRHSREGREVVLEMLGPGEVCRSTRSRLDSRRGSCAWPTATARPGCVGSRCPSTSRVRAWPT